MSRLINLWRGVRDEGTLSTVRRLLRRTVDIFRRLNLQRNFRKLDEMFRTSASRTDVFQFIYTRNLWFSRESRSGFGSTIQYTENARKHIRSIITNYSIESIYDAPCGDFNWMRLVVADSKIQYLGSDIVPDLVEDNRAKYATDRISFALSDIIVDAFPIADLWICRDCLFHFSYRDILGALEKFCESQIKYMLTTTFVNDQQAIRNVDIPTGSFRLIDLFSDPFNFPKNVQYRFLDYLEPDPPREMILLSRDDVIRALPRMRECIRNVPQSP